MKKRNLINRLRAMPTVGRRSSERPRTVMLPPFSVHGHAFHRSELLEQVFANQRLHPTDIVVDSSVFSPQRLALARELLVTFPPVVLPPVADELEDLKGKPELAELAAIVFKDGVLNPRFRRDRGDVLQRYPRFAMRYVNLLHWRKQAIEVLVRRIPIPPAGKARGKLIKELSKSGVGDETLQLANKKHDLTRGTDEYLAMYAVLGPIVTGRDCYLFTADEDLLLQVQKLSELIFDDYGAYLIAKDFRENPDRYGHRHEATSMFFDGPVEAIGRRFHPNHLLPPVPLTNTCATHVVDVLKCWRLTWVAARNMEPAIAFQDEDLANRKGDPGDGRSILFSAPDEGAPKGCRHKGLHFLLGTPKYLKIDRETWGPIPVFDLFRTYSGDGEERTDHSRLVTLHQHQMQRVIASMEKRFELLGGDKTP